MAESGASLAKLLSVNISTRQAIFKGRKWRETGDEFWTGEGFMVSKFPKSWLAWIIA
jgi:hypothetical protein